MPSTGSFIKSIGNQLITPSFIESKRGTPVQAPSKSLAQNLIAYWALDDTSWNDSTGNGHTLAMTNGDVGITTGLIGNAAQITTANNGWLYNDTISVTGAWSISSWFNVQSDNQTNEYPCQWATGIIEGVNTGGANVVDVLGDHDSNNGWSYDGVFGQNYGQFQTPGENIWNHSVVVNDPSTGLHWYLNNILITSGPAATRDWTGFVLGGQAGGFPGVTDVNVDETGIWNKVLTPTDINTLHNNRNGLTYPFITTASPFIHFR